jgi:hypothetical protein
MAHYNDILGAVPQRPLIALALAGLAAAAGYLWARGSDSAALLEDGGGAVWMRPGEPVWLGVRGPGPREAIFRRTFEAGEKTFTFKALKLAQVFVDGRGVHADSDLSAWRTERRVDLGELRPGKHELRVAVFNQDGPNALWAPGEGWESSRDEKTWTPAVPAARAEPHELSLSFGTAGGAVAGLLRLFVPLFALVVAGCFALPRPPRAAELRWLLHAAWGALVLNAAGKLALTTGFDASAHLEYLRFVADNKRLPGVLEGWQMFQAPLYYVVAAPLQALAGPAWLRLISYLCGAAQIELSFRTARLMFPGRGELQALGALLGGLMPMGIYSALSVGNEALAGALTAAALYAAARLSARTKAPSIRELAGLGALLGLAALAKANAVIAAAPVLALLAASSRPRWKAPAVALSAMAAVAGWYYLGNWIKFGTPLIAASYGRAAAGGALPIWAWWQDPGYLTAGRLFSFGEALRYPIFSSLSGIWDALYSTLWLDGQLSSMASLESRPPWNYGFVLSQSWLSLLPMACLLIGAWRALASTNKLCWFFAGVLGIYLLAVFGLYLRLPIYSAAKATYTLGAIPAYVAVALLGFEPLLRGKWSRAAAFGWMACWAVSAYLGYFVL